MLDNFKRLLIDSVIKIYKRNCQTTHYKSIESISVLIGFLKLFMNQQYKLSFQLSTHATPNTDCNLRNASNLHSKQNFRPPTKSHKNHGNCKQFYSHAN